MNCTTPWLYRVTRELYGETIEICSGNKSHEAAEFYIQNRLPNFEECKNPCTSMEIISNLKMMKNTTLTKSRVKLIFTRKLQVHEEKLVKSELSLIAELGGYLGMTLGVSLLDLEGFLGAVKARSIKFFH